MNFVRLIIFVSAIFTVPICYAVERSSVYSKIPDRVVINPLNLFSDSQQTEIRDKLQEINANGYLSVPEEALEEFLPDVLQKKLEDSHLYTSRQHLNWILDDSSFKKQEMEFLGFLYGGERISARIFSDKNKNIYKLIELNITKTRNVVMPGPLINHSVDGYPAIFMILKDPSGKVKSTLSWNDNSRGYILEMNGEFPREKSTDNYLVKIANQLY